MAIGSVGSDGLMEATSKASGARPFVSRDCGVIV
jgi:hypothetical protein